MRDLSLKGVARRFLGITGNFEVVSDIFGVSAISGVASVRSKLESLAREEYSFSMSECIYGWTAAFEQTWSHVVIRIRLNPDAGIAAGTMNTLRNTWQNGIENTWNNQWAIARSGELACRLSFDVQWVTAGQHHTVRVRQGPGQTNMTLWDTSDSGAVAAHEFGHMHGNPDEYPDPNCPGRSPVNTGTVMDNNSANVPARLVTRFATSIGSTIVSP